MTRLDSLFSLLARAPRGHLLALVALLLLGSMTEGIGIILLVAAEMLGAEYGVGAYILQAESLYDLQRLFAGVVILSVLGVLASSVIGMLEKRLLRWRS